MPVTLTNAGIQFSDGTFTNTNPIPSGTQMFFLMAAAPSGWTKIVTDIANDRILRINTTSGSGTGGTSSTTSVSTLPDHTHTLGTNDFASVTHSHTLTAGNHTHSYRQITNALTNNQGGPGTVGGTGVTGIVDNSPSGSAWTSDAFGAGAKNPNPGQGAVAGSGITGTSGASTNHTHTLTTGTGPSVNWQPKYIDSILCSKN
jgi:hypothetical protein